jgi:flagellar L-ring protein FlgH
MRIRMFILVWLFLWLTAGLAPAAPGNSLFVRTEEEKLNTSLRHKGMKTDAAENVYGAKEEASSIPALTRRTPVLKASWITVAEPSPKDYRVHDLITIIVNEVSKNSTKADTKADREYTVDSKLQDWISLSGLNLRPDKQSHGDPKVGFSYDREFEGKGDIKREDSLTARIQAKVIDVMPNRTLLLEATKKVTTDEEETTIILSGVCRSKDIGIDNTILSSQLADLDLRKSHNGIARDATKRGLLSGLTDWLGIF